MRNYFFMNSRWIIFLVALLGMAQLVSAQPGEFVEKPRKVKMPKYFVAEFPKKSIPITGIKVRQAVWDSTRLGYLQKGMINIKAEALPAKDLTIFLQEYVDKQYEEGYKKTGSQLLVFVKELRVNERTFFSSEFAFSRISADAWISEDATNYRQVASIDTVLTYTSMADVTSEHGTNIAKGLYQLILEALKNAQAGNFKTEQTLGEEEINRKERERFNQPILTETIFREGAYMNFGEFLQNNPSVASFETSVFEKKKIKIETLSGNTRKEITPWGICKGGEIYKYHEQELIPIEKNYDGFIISDYMEKSHRRNSGIFMGSVFGGLIGAGITSATSSKMYSVTNIPYITKKQPEACAIDMKTGELTF